MREKERGQAMILIVVGIVGLIAIVGLAIDGGQLHNSRRQVQNAADSAAMAGTQALLDSRINDCQGASLSPNNIDDAVGNAILRYVNQYGIANDGATGHIAAWYVDANSDNVASAGSHALTSADLDTITGVRVTLAFTEPTTFMKVIGRNEMNTQGEAAAMYGPVTQMGGGILPIGVPLKVVEQLAPGETFHILETNNHNGGSFCTDPDDSTTCIGDPASHNAHRGWLNLNYIYNTEYLAQSDPLYRTFEVNVANRGCGSDPSISTDDGLKGWAIGDCPYPYPIFAGRPPDPDGTAYTDGDFIHGDPGARDVSAQNIEEGYAGKTSYAPIFDFIYMSDYMDDNFSQPEGIGWPRAGGGGHAFLYHVVGFTAVEIQEYDKSGGTKSLVANFQNAVVGQGQITPGFGPASGSADPCATTLYSIVLWE